MILRPTVCQNARGCDSLALACLTRHETKLPRKVLIGTYSREGERRSFVYYRDIPAAFHFVVYNVRSFNSDTFNQYNFPSQHAVTRYAIIRTAWNGCPGDGKIDFSSGFKQQIRQQAPQCDRTAKVLPTARLMQPNNARFMAIWPANQEIAERRLFSLSEHGKSEQCRTECESRKPHIPHPEGTYSLGNTFLAASGNRKCVIVAWSWEPLFDTRSIVGVPHAPASMADLMGPPSSDGRPGSVNEVL